MAGLGLVGCGEEETCTPECGNRVCGTDPVCGQSCGSCQAGETCNASGVCEGGCSPDCGARECGLDPVCNTQSCGTCGAGETCNASGVCEGGCSPDCGARECGLDPVCNTQSCGTCGAGETCDAAGVCQPDQQASLTLTHAGVDYDSGSSYNVPDDNDPASSNIALFSEQLDIFSVRNLGAAALTLNTLTLTPAAGSHAEEWSLRDANDLAHPVLVVQDVQIAAGATFDFYVRLYPVYSGERRASLALTYTDADGAKSYSLNVTGSGRPSDDARPFTGASPVLHKLLGITSTDEQATAMVADASGNTFILLQTKVVPGYDGFYYDLVLARVNPEGTLAWAKIYSRQNAWEWCTDPGQNDETGGSPNALVYGPDGYLYVAAAASSGNTNNNNGALVLKIDPADGAMQWQSIWRPEWAASPLDRMSATGYALAVADGRVFVTGTSGDGNAHGTLGSNSSVFLVGLDAVDGGLLFQRAVDVAVGYNDRGYAVVALPDASAVFVGGLTNGRGLLMRFTGTDGADPTLAWTKQVDMGLGSNVYGLALDGADVVVAADRRGASTYFSVLKIAGADGSLLWGKTYPAGANDSSNTNVVYVSGQHVYAGGRIGLSVFDAQQGDGMLLRLDKDTGAFSFGGVYYTGKGPDEIEEHRIKGLAVAGSSLFVAGQVYTGSTGTPGYRYDGYWYEADAALEDYAPAISDIAAPDLYTCSNGAVQDAATQVAAAWDPLPAEVLWQDALAKKEGHGATVDEDFFWMKLDLAP